MQKWAKDKIKLTRQLSIARAGDTSKVSYILMLFDNVVVTLDLQANQIHELERAWIRMTVIDI